MECENPDFILTGQGINSGIEVVEACDPREQAEWTRFAKNVQASEEPISRDIGLMDPQRKPKFRNLVQRAIFSKAKKSSSDVDQLLIYSNTDLDNFEDLEWKLSALEACENPGSKFSKIWIISGRDVFCLAS
ncbi:hypothetical protein [uncultured Ruegeria sp.]|uniref:hypothetical protein n=1 Tax=uncultured Ruegeria sp. TaxID=259304 RepID=UPI00262E6E11|nr:hypothetical protein [uncultured Ruegeria sp.]